MTNTETVGTERLEEIAAEYGDMAGTLDGALKDGPGAASAFYMSCSLGEIASMATELIASRTQSPAEWQIRAGAEALAALEDMPVNNLMMIHAEHVLRAASIPAPERSKEETVGLCISAIQAERDKPIEGPEHGAWDRGRRDGLTKAIKILSALETLPLHKEVEAVAWQARRETWPDGYWSNPTQLAHSPVVDFGEGWSTRLLYTLPVPVPVTITDGWLRDTAMNVMLATEVEEAMRILSAAISKPGEQG